MQRKGLEPNAASYECTVRALARNHQYDAAVCLLNEMWQHEDGPRPTTVSYNAIISACATASPVRWVTAVQLFEEMSLRGIRRDVMTYNVVMKALGRQGQCDAVLDLLQSLQQNGM